MRQDSTKPAADTPPSSADDASAWAPFRYPAFSLLWSAMLISSIGTWMHSVGAGWLMTTLDPTPAIVTLVQAATSLPIFLFALLAGTLADRSDKRRLLVTVNTLMAIVIGVLALLVARGLMTPTLLLAFTFLIGAGAAFIAPTWQAIVPELVPRPCLKSAIALNSMGMNLSRAVGPAIAGFLITAVSLAAPFAVNALTYVIIIAALLLWKRPERAPSSLPPEPLGAAMLTGLRHAAHNGPLRATLVRATGFFLFASAYWSLLPLVARGVPGGGAEFYGLLLAAIGSGAVFGALLLPKLKRWLDTNWLASVGALVTAFAMVLLALVESRSVDLFAAFLGGLGWIAVLTSLNISAQTALPDWVRARGLSIYLMVFFGAMALGSALWGQVATALSVEQTLLIAAAAGVLAIPVTWRWRLGLGEDLDLSPSSFWPAPVLHGAHGTADDRGPVMVTIDYRIDPAEEHGFVHAIHALAGERYRDGAYQWGVFQDAEDPACWTEWFLVPSWNEHLRQHERATEHDRSIQERVNAFHRDMDPPRVRHLLAPGAAA